MTYVYTAANDYIGTLAVAHPNDEIKQHCVLLKKFHDKKLWHQLTLQLETLVVLPYFNDNLELVNLYQKFIKEFETKMNQLRFVRIVLVIMREFKEPAECISFLQAVSEKISPEREKEAFSLCLTEIAWLKVKLNLFDDCKQLCEKAFAILESITGVDPIVHSSYYRVQSLYYKLKVSSTEFYKNTLMYLVYSPLDNITLYDQQCFAFDLGIAALLSEDIHNFGELLQHPVLSSLQGSQREWLSKVLFAFNSGDIQKFESLVNQHKVDIESIEALNSSLEFLRRKIRILALMELVFNRTAEERTIDFAVIAQAANVNIDEVEILVMKALSLKLIKGVIDELDKTVSVSWVQPRVLNLQQVQKMEQRVGKWIENVNEVLTFMTNETAPELLT